jgi:membrane protein YqaA with SNARE-associated domain
VEYLVAFAIVAAMTITPLPMPPSWLVLAYISLELDASAPGVVVAGALGAGAGRTGLAAWTRALGPRLMSAATRANVDALAAHLHGRRSHLGVAAVLAVSPPPAGALYTAAGVLRVNLALVGGAAFCGRLVTYGLAVALIGATAPEIADRLRDWIGPWQIALGLLAVVAALWVLGRLDWRVLFEQRRVTIRRR